VALGADPGLRIGVPHVPAVLDDPQGGLDVPPAPLVLQSASEGLGDEGAALPPPDPAIELRHQIISETYVQPHGHTLTHSRRQARTTSPRTDDRHVYEQAVDWEPTDPRLEELADSMVRYLEQRCEEAVTPNRDLDDPTVAALLASHFGNASSPDALSAAPSLICTGGWPSAARRL